MRIKNTRTVEKLPSICPQKVMEIRIKNTRKEWGDEMAINLRLVPKLNELANISMIFVNC